MSGRNRERRNPSIEALRALLALHEEGSVRAAARKLEQAQSVVSRKLEVFLTADACGAILLAKSKGALQLTDAGSAAVPATRELVEQYDQLLDFLRGRRIAPQLVRLAVGSFAAQYYVPRAVSILRDSQNMGEIKTDIARGAERITGVLDRRYDFAVVSHDAALIEEIAAQHGARSTDLSVQRLAEQQMCVIARKGTSTGRELESIRARRKVPLQKLQRWNLVGLDRRSGIRRQLEHHFGRPEDVHFLAEGGGWMAAKEFVRYDLGAAIVPLATLSAEDCQDFVLRRLMNQFRVSQMLVHRRETLSPTHRAVKQALQNAATSHQTEVEKKWKRILSD